MKQMQSDITLKPCPFCGHKPHYIHGPEFEGVTGVFCPWCRALVRFPITWAKRETTGENMANWARLYNRREP